MELLLFVMIVAMALWVLKVTEYNVLHIQDDGQSCKLLYMVTQQACGSYDWHVAEVL
jgi:hypothetical protein